MREPWQDVWMFADWGGLGGHPAIRPSALGLAILCIASTQCPCRTKAHRNGGSSLRVTPSPELSEHRTSSALGKWVASPLIMTATQRDEEESMSLPPPPPPPHVSTTHVGEGGHQVRLKGGETARAVHSGARYRVLWCAVVCRGGSLVALGGTKFNVDGQGQQSVHTDARPGQTLGELVSQAGRVCGLLLLVLAVGRVRRKGVRQTGWRANGWWWVRQGEGDAGHTAGPPALAPCGLSVSGRWLCREHVMLMSWRSSKCPDLQLD